jgi:hypothetical protein
MNTNLTSHSHKYEIITVMIRAVGFLIIFCFTENGITQDSHYWTNQYGTDAQLLGGLVVGGANDLSATYYNPGAIALTEDERLVLSTEAVEFISIYLKGGTVGDKDLSSVQTRPAPGIFALRFLKDSLQINHFTFSVLTRRNFEHDFQEVSIFSQDVIDDWLGIENFSGEFMAGNRLTETWIGISYSRNLSNITGLGITQFVAVRNHDVRYQTIAQAVNDEGLGQTGILIDHWKYTNISLLWKIGFVSKEGNLSYGVTLTTPSVDITGNGNYFLNRSLMGTSEDPILISGSNEDLPVSYRSPFSISIGASYRFGRTALYFTAEYFNKISQYTVMHVKEPDIQTQANGNDIKLQNELDRVINYGIGVEQKISELVSLYGSFYTDFSGVSPNSNSDLTFAGYNIYHLTVGSSFTLFNLKLTFGVGLGIGTEEIENLADYSSSALQNYLLGRFGSQDIRYRSLKLVFGLSSGL